MNEPNYIVRLERQVSKLGIEIESLRQWKREAIEVLDEWDETWIAADKPGSLGKSKAQGVKELVESLRQRVKELEARCIQHAGEKEKLKAELAALKAGQGEPVAEVVMFNGFKDIRYNVKDVEVGDKLYTAPTIPEGWEWQHVAATTLARFIHHGSPFEGDEKWAEIADVAIKLLNQPYAAAPKPEG